MQCYFHPVSSSSRCLQVGGMFGLAMRTCHGCDGHTVHIGRRFACPRCRKSGKLGARKCLVCDGRGCTERPVSPCSKCSGAGYVRKFFVKKKCGACAGKGFGVDPDDDEVPHPRPPPREPSPVRPPGRKRRRAEGRPHPMLHGSDSGSSSSSGDNTSFTEDSLHSANDHDGPLDLRPVASDSEDSLEDVRESGRNVRRRIENEDPSER